MTKIILLDAEEGSRYLGITVDTFKNKITKNKIKAFALKRMTGDFYGVSRSALYDFEDIKKLKIR